jgi:hypothetical protein
LLEQNKGDKNKFTEDDVLSLTKEMVLNKKTENLKVEKNNEFLSNLSEEEVSALNLERVKAWKTLSDKDKYIATKSEVLNNEVEKLVKDYVVTKEIIAKSQSENKELSPEFIQYVGELEENVKTKASELSSLEKEYTDSKNKIGSVEEELDFLKRNYSTKEKFVETVKLGFADLYVNATKKLPLFRSL